jgi:hypothetical protein
MQDKEPEVQINRIDEVGEIGEELYDKISERIKTNMADNQRLLLNPAEHNFLKSNAEPLKEPENKLTIGIGSAQGFITIEFNAPVQKIIMTKSHAREFARRISKESLG